MKKIVIVCLAAATLAAMAAYTINGSYNSTFGYLTGQDASGNYVSAFGAGAAGYSTGSTRSTFVGAASGVNAYYPTDCVGIGYRTLRGANSCDSCVAIGARTMTDSTGCSDCVFIGRQRDEETWSGRSDMTWINGQIIAYPGRLAIHDQPLAEQDESMDEATHDWRYYDDGWRLPTIDLETIETNGEYKTRLTLRADDVRMDAGTFDGRMFTNLENVVYVSDGRAATNAAGVVRTLMGLSGGEWFVSANGSDSNDGQSVSRPKATLDAALSLAGENDVVYVLAGRYAWPQFYATNSVAPKRVHIVGIGGAENVVLDASLIGQGGYAVMSGDTKLPYVIGVTLRGGESSLNIGRGAISSSGMGMLTTIVFEDCIFEGMDTTVKSNHSVWEYCWLFRCRVRDCIFRTTNTGNFYTIFGGAWVYDSVLDFETGGPINLAGKVSFDNCFIRCGELHKPMCYNGGSYAGWGSDNPRFLDCTLVVSNVYDSGLGTYRGCLVGVGTGAGVAPTSLPIAEGTLATNAQTVADAIGTKYRPAESDSAMYFLGFNSRHDRCIRDASIKSVLDTITNVTGAVVFSGTAYTLMSTAGGETARLDAQARMDAVLDAWTNGVQRVTVDEEE